MICTVFGCPSRGAPQDVEREEFVNDGAVRIGFWLSCGHYVQDHRPASPSPVAPWFAKTRVCNDGS